jgi:hypothetical protein
MAHKAAPKLPRLRMREELLKVLPAPLLRNIYPCFLHISITRTFLDKNNLPAMLSLCSRHQSLQGSLVKMLMASKASCLSKVTSLGLPIVALDTVYRLSKEVDRMLSLQTILH